MKRLPFYQKKVNQVKTVYFIDTGTKVMYACLCKAQDWHPKGDHGFPKEKNQGLRPCMHALFFFSMLVRSTSMQAGKIVDFKSA